MCSVKHRRGAWQLPFIMWTLFVRHYWKKFDKFWYQGFTLKRVEIMQSWFTPIRYKVYFGRSKVTFSSVSAFYGPPEIQRYEEVGACFHTMLLAEPLKEKTHLEAFPSQSQHLMTKQFWKYSGRSHVTTQVTLPTHFAKQCPQERHTILYRELPFKSIFLIIVGVFFLKVLHKNTQ